MYRIIMKDGTEVLINTKSIVYVRTNHLKTSIIIKFGDNRHISFVQGAIEKDISKILDEIYDAFSK